MLRGLLGVLSLTPAPQQQQERRAGLASSTAPAALSALLLLSRPAYAAEQLAFSGGARVVDGDTLAISTGSGEARRVRLFGVDAPESKQSCARAGRDWACGAAAADALQRRVGRASVHCVPHNTDRYGRTVALCDVGGEDLGAWMVRNGWALAYRAYGGKAYDSAGASSAPLCFELASLLTEAEAQAASRGVWADGVSLQPPWEWRKAKLQQRESRPRTELR